MNKIESFRIVAKIGTMTTPEQIFEEDTNMLNEILKISQTDPMELMHKASEMQYAALQEYHRQLMIARIEYFIAGIAVIIIFHYLWTWFQNTQKHLKQISDAAQSLAKNEKRQSEPSDERKNQNSQEPKLHFPQSLDQRSQPPVSKVKCAPADSLSSHPDARYMPKN